jgi:hypothetical protein
MQNAIKLEYISNLNSGKNAFNPYNSVTKFLFHLFWKFTFEDPQCAHNDTYIHSIDVCRPESWLTIMSCYCSSLSWIVLAWEVRTVEYLINDQSENGIQVLHCSNMYKICKTYWDHVLNNILFVCEWIGPGYT